VAAARRFSRSFRPLHIPERDHEQRGSVGTP
jgi:hypothetical protein